ncbi:hypothetical protein BDR07DRAFT_226436 [Suillus spraguei]|nr:hypothetical protein BDR07DRAFT_226436 [Suillus spraguei]
MIDLVQLINRPDLLLSSSLAHQCLSTFPIPLSLLTWYLVFKHRVICIIVCSNDTDECILNLKFTPLRSLLVTIKWVGVSCCRLDWLRWRPSTVVQTTRLWYVILYSI